MFQKRDENILLEFNQLTGRDIVSYFTDVSLFLRTDYINIIDYFSGKIKSIGSQPFSRFEDLQRRNRLMFEAYHSYSRRMKDSRWWELVEQLEDIDSRFMTLRNINRWSRSSATNFAYSPTIQIDHQLQQHQTLERVAKDILGQSNSEDSWVDIAFTNDLSEEDYTSQGGNPLKLTLDNTINLGITINSVVDYLVGKSIYGKDIDRSFRFENDDIVVLNYDSTIKQSVEILIQLKKNDNPESPELGLQKSTIIGGNRALMNFPVISRQLSETFASDDSLKEFTINQIFTEQDNVFIEYSVKTRLNEIEIGSVPL